MARTDSEPSIELSYHGSSTDRVELQPSTRNVKQDSDEHALPVEGDESAGFSLPPVDRGRDAWLFLAACFMIEGTMWGFPSVYGIFQDYYSTHEAFAGSSALPVVGTCAMGTMYLGLPVAFIILKQFPRVIRYANVTGLVVACVSLAMASFAKTVGHLIATQGILFAVGGVFAWAPILFYINEWFVQRLSMAYGVLMAGLGLAGTVLPLVLRWLLTSYGYQTTLRVSAIVMFVLTAPFLFFLKPRVPPSQVTHSRRIDFSFCTSPSYVVSQFGNIIVGVGYFLPPIFLPSYARSLGAGSFTSVLTIILLSGAACIGNVLMGILTGRFHFATCMLVSTIGTAIAVFFFWGFSESLPMLYVFSILYGLFASSFPAAWSGVLPVVKQERPGADMGMLFCSLAAGKGIGNIASGPLSEALLHSAPWTGAKFAYGSGYGALIVFTGATALCGALSFFARRVHLYGFSLYLR